MEAILMVRDEVVSFEDISERASGCLTVMWDNTNCQEARAEAASKLTYWLSVLDLIETEKAYRYGIDVIDSNTQF